MKQQQKIQRLGFFEEAVGVLTELTEDEGFLNARIGRLVLLLPPEMENTWCPLLGTRIGILRTDIPRKEYLVRRIAGGKSPVLEEVGSISQTLCEVQQEGERE
jgi:hypothetical protein